MEYTIQMIEWFYDFNVYPRRLKAGELIKVDKQTLDKMNQSHPGCCEVVDMRVPPSNVKPQPKTSKKKKKEKDAKD